MVSTQFSDIFFGLIRTKSAAKNVTFIHPGRAGNAEMDRGLGLTERERETKSEGHTHMLE